MMLDGYQREIMTNGDTTGVVWVNDPNDPPKMYGWICPVCGRGLSPFTAVCPCRNDGKGWEVTC